METKPIIIEKGQVIIRPTAGNILLTQYQIADLFGVHVQAVNSNIGLIFKRGTLHEDEVSCQTKSKGGRIQILYNMEMITALAFRLKSEQAELFRHWIVRTALNSHGIWKISGMGIMLN
ncbi:protein-tyrosine kinase [Bacteroides sp. 224]|uniref:protein-tyrosine kinase n=1 Tax=Bacteroides sp. 224 TaxID=2302936 RepID=UPI0013D605F9|nr:protein-tyrosine kinase [Bacteroides sp. 224]NDV64701.1 protein-tyrosine kinase [Bacteroides sp. 224]